MSVTAVKPSDSNLASGPLSLGKRSTASVTGDSSAAWLVERIGRPRTLGLCLLYSAVVTFVFSVVTGATDILAASVMMSFFTLGAWGVLYAYTPEIYPTSARGTGMGWAGGVAAKT